MKIFTKKSILQKIILAIVIIILFNFAVPIQSSAANIFEKTGGKILSELLKLVDALRRCNYGTLK